MSAPRRARSQGSKRLYAWRSEQFWSVTTIIDGGIPKQRVLVPWGIKAVSKAVIERRASVQAMLAECETPTACAKPDARLCTSCDDLMRWLKGAPYGQKERAAELGTAVHAAAEAHRLGRPMPPWEPDVAPYMHGFEQWLQDFNPKFLAVEMTVFNRTERYAGTLDAIVEIGGRRLVIDYKTARKGIYPEIGLQLAAYRYAEFAGLPDGREAPMPIVHGAAGLELKPDAPYGFKPVKANREVFRAFLFAREVFRFSEETADEIIGEDLNPVVMAATAETMQAIQGAA